MKRTLILLFALLALGTFALAASLPSSGTVTVKNDSGVQVGTGTIANGKLALSLASGTSGFVTITVTAADGSSQSYEAMVKAGGQVTVVDSGQLSDLSSFAKTGGVDSVDVSETTESQTPESQTPDNQTSQAGQPETPDSTTAGQEDTSSQTGDASSGSSPDTNASTDSSPDSSASLDNQTETETGSTSGDDQVKVGSNLSGGVSTHTGSDGTSTDTSASGSASTDD